MGIISRKLVIKGNMMNSYLFVQHITFIWEFLATSRSSYRCRNLEIPSQARACLASRPAGGAPPKRSDRRYFEDEASRIDLFVARSLLH